MREAEIKDMMTRELRRSFHVMSEDEILRSIKRYPSVKDINARARRMRKRNPTDYNKDLMAQFKLSRQKAMKSITKDIESKIEKRFGKGEIEMEKKIEDTPFLIDLFDVKEKVCYEICLGNGQEIFKDVLKALIIGAKKLVVFSGSYPNPWGNTGYDYARRHWAMLKGKLNLEAEVIDFMS